MSDEQRYFLTLCQRLPARLSVEQAGWLLNCAPHNIRIPVRAGLLKPIGNPPENGEKLFAADELLELLKNRAWLAKGPTRFTGATSSRIKPAGNPARTVWAISTRRPSRNRHPAFSTCPRSLNSSTRPFSANGERPVGICCGGSRRAF